MQSMAIAFLEAARRPAGTSSVLALREDRHDPVLDSSILEGLPRISLDDSTETSTHAKTSSSFYKPCHPDRTDVRAPFPNNTWPTQSPPFVPTCSPASPTNFSTNPLSATLLSQVFQFSAPPSTTVHRLPTSRQTKEAIRQRQQQHRAELRRRKACDRERKRVQDMNEAFTQLKASLQNWLPLFDERCLRLSKIEILRCASRYIRHLAKKLGIPHPVDLLSEDSLSDSSFLDSD